MNIQNADVSPKTVYIHRNPLEEIGILEVEKKVLKGKLVTFKFNGRNYYAKTNAYGIAQKPSIRMSSLSS